MISDNGVVFAATRAANKQVSIAHVLKMCRPKATEVEIENALIRAWARGYLMVITNLSWATLSTKGWQLATKNGWTGGRSQETTGKPYSYVDPKE